MAAVDALTTVLPVLLLFAVGAVLGRTGLLAPAVADGLRRLVLNVTLPAALFLTFLRVDVEPRLLLIVVCVFVACMVVLAAGPWIGQAIRADRPYTPHLFTGFEAGMLGYAMFASAWGGDELWRFAIVDIGQVVFVFFVLAPAVAQRASGTRVALASVARSFVRTPVIVAIVGGLAAGGLGLTDPLQRFAITGAALEALALLAVMTTPLIGLVIGATTRLRPGSLGVPTRVVATRLVVWVPLALVFNAVVVRGVLGLDPLFEAAVLTMAILPPPFVIPLYLRTRGGPDPERDSVTNTLSVGTFATLVAFAFVVAAVPPA